MSNFKKSISPQRAKDIANQAGQKTLDIPQYFKDAWDLINNDMGNYIGFAFISMLISVITSIIPIIGSLVQSLLNIVLTPGIAIYTHHKRTNQTHDFNTFFEGMKFTGPLLGQYIISILAILLACIPLFIFGFTMSFNDIEKIILSGGFWIIGIPTITLVSYLFISWIFAPHLIIFANMGPWEAMSTSFKTVNKHFLSIIILMFFVIIISIIGVFAFCIGLLWAIPVSHTAIYLTFATLFLGDENDDNDIDDFLEHLV